MTRIACLTLATAVLLSAAGTAVVRAQSAAQAPASAAPSPAARSVFTVLALDACKRVTGDKTVGIDGGTDGGRWACGGPKGFEILFAEGDLRQFLAYGDKARAQRTASQTLGPFNSIFKDTTAAPAKDRATIEWRGTQVGGTFVPFATIVRYHTDTGDDGSGKRRRGQTLVVTKLGAPGGSEACHAAYIDAHANKDANALAQKTADEMARGFDCRKNPVLVGEKGTAPPVAQTRT